MFHSPPAVSINLRIFQKGRCLPDFAVALVPWLMILGLVEPWMDRREVDPSAPDHGNEIKFNSYPILSYPGVGR